MIITLWMLKRARSNVLANDKGVAMKRRARWFCIAGTLTLASTSFLVSGASTVAAVVSVQPAYLHAAFASRTQPPTQAQCVSAFTAPCYTPAQIETAYNEQPLFSRGITGRGETIVIVDSFGSPTIQSDLATFDAQFGLPAPPSFNIIQPAGAVPAYDPTNSTMVSWAGETTLDVEWSHSIAPGANILLVETPVAETEGVAGFPQIIEAENYVIDHHLGQVISQSFGATEQTFPTPQSLLDLRSAYFNAYRHHVTVLAGSGDTGATNYSNVAGTMLYTFPAVSWPASDPLVTGVGGTQLSLNASGQRTAPDQVWNDTYNTGLNEAFFGNAGPNPLATGGGLSSIFRRPAYQDSVARVVGDARGMPDISMSAACSGLVVAYQGYQPNPGWYVDCGTSEASPLFAGVVALADQVAHHSLGLINPALYALKAEHAPGLVPVTTGNNTVSFTQNGTEYTVTGYNASPGYSTVAGVGTVNAALFVPELAFAGGFHWRR
jgi:subtilase family serine protease